MCKTFLLKKYIELFGLHSIKRLEYPSNCKFSKVRNHVYSIGNFMLLYQALQTEQLLSHPSCRSQIQVHYLVYLCAELLSYAFFLHILKYKTHHCQMFHHGCIYPFRIILNFSMKEPLLLNELVEHPFLHILILTTTIDLTVLKQSS